MSEDRGMFGHAEGGAGHGAGAVSEGASLPIRPPSRTATMGGVGVVLLTGMAALFGFAANYTMTAIDWILAAMVALLTLGGAFALVRFIRAHPGGIGEARFDTRNPDDPPPGP